MKTTNPEKITEMVKQYFLDEQWAARNDVDVSWTKSRSSYQISSIIRTKHKGEERLCAAIANNRDLEALPNEGASRESWISLTSSVLVSFTHVS